MTKIKTGGIDERGWEKLKEVIAERDEKGLSSASK
jgi:hypothetical protein